jgi:hypothetical protein
MTLAGEGIELAVSTEHNQHADYLPAARALHLNDELTIVPGNEVTTPRGHFNAFPVSLDSPPAKAWITNWPVLWEEIRSDTNVQVVILNHPTDMHSGFTPFARTNLNLVTGRNLRGDFPFQFDAMEVINSGAMRSDWMETFRAWFALLNRGYRITGIGASDSHDVSRFIVGQGRTYIKTDDRSPGRIDIRSACASLREGRAVVSLGLFPQLEIRAGGRSAGPGEMIGAGNNEIELRGSASWPDWMLAGKGERRCNVRIFANGRELLAIPFRGPQNGDYFKFKRKVRRPGQDTWYVMVVDAPGVTNASWAVARPYQPASIHWDPALIGATNPVRVDADNDGKFSAPREIAEGLVQSFGHSIPRLLNVLAEYDWATAVQVAELLELRGTDFRDPEFQSALRAAGKQVEQAFEEYRKALE